MELKQLESFVSVADNLSFSKAAKDLFLTQPTVSAHIATLEKELGARLFERTTKSLKLSELGKAIYPYAARMIELKGNIEAMSTEGEGKPLCLGASTIPATYLLPAILAELSKEDGMRFRIRQGNSSEVEEMVRDGAVDAGIIGRRTTDNLLESEELCTDRMVLVTPVNAYYTKLRRSSAPIEKLMIEPLILREEGSGTQKAADGFLEKYSDRPLNIIIRNNDQEAIKRMVEAGAGVSVMSYYAAADMEKAGKVYCYPIKLDEERCFYIICRKDRQHSPSLNTFIAKAHRIYG